MESTEYWRSRAKEIREQAEHVGDPVAKRTLLSIAKSYEQLARRAEARGKRKNNNDKS
jgi:hypothetical protein